MALSNNWQDGLVELLLQLSMAPAGLPDPYVNIYTDLPSPDGGYLGTTPAAGDGYAGPVHVAGDTFWTFDGTATGTVFNLAVGMGTPTADWGPIVGWALVDSGGGLITEPVEFDDPLTVTVGVAFTLDANLLGLVVT